MFLTPGLTAAIFLLQAIEHEGPFQGRLIAKRDIRVPVGNFQQHFSNCPAVSLAQIWQFFYDLSHAHVHKLKGSSAVARMKFTGWFRQFDKSAPGNWRR